MKTKVIQVEGMSCLHCVNSIEGALFNLSGVEVAKVNLNENSVAVTFDEDELSLEKLKLTIKDQGYDVKAPL